MDQPKRSKTCIKIGNLSKLKNINFYVLYTLEPRFRHLGGTVKNMCLNGDVLKSKNETRMQQNVLLVKYVVSSDCLRDEI